MFSNSPHLNFLDAGSYLPKGLFKWNNRFQIKKNNAVKSLAALFLTICSTVLFLTVNFLVTVDGFVAKFFLYADKLVVFCHTVAAGH